MAATVDIGALITRRPEIRGGRPIIAGTGVTVQRIATWYTMGLTAEEMARKLPHLTLAQVYAALAYYHANQAEIDAAISEDDGEAERLERMHGQPRRAS